jgi:NADH dehydrogenase [ubiquinone] 1 alpha subcomplex assembly factor 1
MYRILIIFLISTMLQSMTLFDFSKDSNLSNWRILDDVVMGGRSNGIFKLNEDNHGEFFW